MRSPSIALTLLVTALTGCGPLFYSEVAIEELCAAHPDTRFDLSGPAVPVVLSQKVLLDLRAALPQDAEPVEAEGRISRLHVLARSGISDFGFVDHVSLHVGPGHQPEVTAEVLAYDRASEPVGVELSLSGDRFDLQPLLRSRELVGHVALTGHLPPEPFMADVEVCLQARIRYAY